MDAERVDRVEKQLNHHLNNRKCESCTVKGKSYADCFDNLFTDALDVIRELKAENERLKQEKLVNVDKLRERLGFAESCDKCKKNSWKCNRDIKISKSL